MYPCVERKTGLRLAAKYVKINCKEDRRNMEREIDVMSGLHHPRIVQLYDAFDNKNQIICVLELYVNLSLYVRSLYLDILLLLVQWIESKVENYSIG